MAENPGIPPTTRRLAITVRGVVQGVGFRPFVYNAARSRGLSGWVRNEADTVRIEVQGDGAAVEAFVEALRRDHPPQARVEAVEVEEISPLRRAVVARRGVGGEGCPGRPPSPHPSPLPKGEGTAFEIRPSEGRSAPRPTIPADLATCRECLAEIFDPSQRRYRYPFTNCTNCGPRWSIIGQLPYDRPRTSMASFEMCPECRAEYENPADRRFHAQPIACPRCGPALQLLDNRGRETAAGDAALTAAAEALLAGQIVALKGLGGFQLLVDATDAAGGRPVAPAEAPARPAVCRDVGVVGRGAEVLPGFGRGGRDALLAPVADRAVAAKCETASGLLPSPLSPLPLKSFPASPPAIPTWA